MSDASNSGPRLRRTILRWWKENSARDGLVRTIQSFAGKMWEFACDSTPSRRRQRYGDIEFDWDFRVDTTGATVSWRDRLLGMFHSPYQPTEPVLFREMLGSLSIDFREFTFIDIGSGKGRALLMAADFPFRRILGVELLPALHRAAKANIGNYRSNSQQCFDIDCVLGDATEFAFPAESTVLYLFNPLPESGLVGLINNLEQSLREHPRAVFVLYHNPLLDHVLRRSMSLEKVGGTHQYAIFRNK